MDFFLYAFDCFNMFFFDVFLVMFCFLMAFVCVCSFSTLFKPSYNFYVVCSWCKKVQKLHLTRYAAHRTPLLFPTIATPFRMDISIDFAQMSIFSCSKK